MTRFQRIVLASALCCAVLLGVGAVTLINLTTQVSGTLPAANGGTGNTANGNSGQVLIGDGSGHFTPQDPLITWNTVTLISAAAATATQAGGPIVIPTRSVFGTFSIVGSGITGSPAGCTLVYSVQNNLGGQNSGTLQTFSFTPANSYQTFSTAPPAAEFTADAVNATYACGTYPTAGTISVVFTPASSVGLGWPLPAGTNSIGTVQANAGTNLNTSALALDATVSTLDTDVKADPCGDGHAKSYAFYEASTSGATQLVALSSGKIIYVCSYSFSSSSATANTLKLVYGTASNCATGQTAITPGMVLQAAASTGPIGKVNPNSAGLQTIASNELCLLTNAAQPAQAEVSYVQQ